MKLFHVEYHGIHLDQTKWQTLCEQTEAERDETLQKLYAYTGTPAAQQTFWGEDVLHGPNFDSNAFVLKLMQDNGIHVTGTSKWDLAPHRDHPLVQMLTS